jgi:O-antigen/teichoic acid export membrane protein
MINPVRHRIAGAILATGLARLLRFADQIILLPLLISAWGTETYGEWIALNSVAFFINLAGFGLADAASSDIVLRHSADDADGAARSFSTFILLITIAVVGGFALFFGVVTLFNLSDMISLREIQIADARRVVLILSLSQLLFLYVTPLAGVLGAAMGAARPTFHYGIARAVEILAIAVVIRFGATPTEVASIVLAATVLNIVMNFVVALRRAPWLSFRLADFDLSVVRRTWRPSLGFFGLFICTALIGVNAPRLLVFHFLGAASLTTFMVLMTYTRAARMIAFSLSQATQIEIGREFGNGRLDRVKTLIERVLGGTMGLAVILLAAGLLVAPYVIPAWTRGRVAVVWNVLDVLALGALLGTYFDTLMTATAAFNRTLLVSLGYGLGLAIGLPLAVVLLPSLGLLGMALGLLFPEFMGSCAAMRVLSTAVPRPRISTSPRPFMPFVLFSGKSNDD